MNIAKRCAGTTPAFNVLPALVYTKLYDYSLTSPFTLAEANRWNHRARDMAPSIYWREAGYRLSFKWGYLHYGIEVHK